MCVPDSRDQGPSGRVGGGGASGLCPHRPPQIFLLSRLRATPATAFSSGDHLLCPQYLRALTPSSCLTPTCGGLSEDKSPQVPAEASPQPGSGAWGAERAEEAPGNFLRLGRGPAWMSSPGKVRAQGRGSTTLRGCPGPFSQTRSSHSQGALGLGKGENPLRNSSWLPLRGHNSTENHPAGRAEESCWVHPLISTKSRRPPGPATNGEGGV